MSKKLRFAAIGAVAAIGLTACGGGGAGSGGGNDTANADPADLTIGVSMPTQTSERWIADGNNVKSQLEADNYKVDLQYANDDIPTQQQQIDQMVTEGADLLIVAAIDGTALSGQLQAAADANIPVISYDRLIADAPVDYYVSFDNLKVGQLQGTSLVKALGEPQGKSIVMINGSPTDSNAAQFKKGAHSVLDSSGVKIAKEYDTPDWSPDKAQTEMEQAITAVGKNAIDGVYAANDGTGGGAIAAMKGAGIDPTKVPVTGQDAELAGIQRILKGEQYMTVYKAPKPETEAAAKLAYALATGKPAPSGLINGKTNNGAADIPSVLLDPVAVTKDNIKDTVVADGTYTTAQLCKGSFASACQSAGLTGTR